jgi:MFS transporter, putative metabolite:H+ symporter
MSKNSVKLTVLVAALGYFVDIYDLLLFGIVRVPSLRAIGVPEADLLEVGIRLINSQMAGLLTGGVIWGIWGDKRGRISVLFGSIFLYSIANIANAFVVTPNQYALLRFFAGVGLAGELGAAVTLVSEIMSKEKRGLGTTIVAAVGILGAVFASLVGDYFDWKMAYIVGGLMGLSLLILRVRMYESGMYEQTLENPDVRKGDFRMLFQNWERFSKYARCILIGVPIWFVIGILITFSPELARELGVLNPISASTAIMVSYIGLSLGDLSSGLLSQVLRSRRKVVGIFLALTVGCVAYYATATGVSTTHFYGICAALGFATGYWAVFVTIGAEQFGTNLRATVATTVPNFVRGSVVPITLGFKYLHDAYGTPLVASALWVGALTLLLAGLALRNMQETFAKDLDYHEL